MTASSKNTPSPKSTPVNTSRAASSRSTICLEVLRGSTQHPQRPFPMGRFLIGAGEQCDLRLGGAGMPVLHSILIVDAEGALVEAVAPSPALRVNGEARPSARVQIGDTFAIGGFEFVVQLPNAEAEVEQPRATMTSEHATQSAEQLDDDLAMKSAIELVELIEAEVHHIEDFQSRRQLGAEALLQAALRRAHEDEDQIDGFELADSRVQLGPVANQYAQSEVRQAPQPVSLDTLSPGAKDEIEAQQAGREIEEIIERLNGFSEQLERRSKRLEEHEAGYLEASLELLKAQQRLADHLQVLQKQIEGLESSHSKSLRASA